MSEPTDADLTIEALAARTGMTVRNIRAHQSRGLIDPPVVRGRTGYYGAEHVARLQLIREMQADGLNLAAISKLIGGGEAFAGFRRAIATPFETAGAQIVDAAEIRAALGVDEVDDRVIERAAKLGVFRPLGEDRYEVTSPRLLTAAVEVGELGLRHEAALDVLEKLDRHAQSIARLFVTLFLDEIWKPFQRAGMPAEEWPKVLEAIERLRPLAGEALLGMFEPAMTAAVEKAAERVVTKLGRDGSK